MKNVVPQHTIPGPNLFLLSVNGLEEAEIVLSCRV
jgi:hypothetical protein